MERSKAGKKEKKSIRHITIKPKCNINKHNIVLFYKVLNKYNAIQLTKNKMGFNNRKLTNHPQFLVGDRDVLMLLMNALTVETNYV